MTGARRRAGLVAALAAAVVGLARCASPGIPPGGPEDLSPPQLVAVAPESGATNVRARELVLEFDEVVSEVPTGANAAIGGGEPGGGGFGGGAPTGPSLAGIVLLSPRAGAVRVDWHRDRLSVRPRDPLRSNTTYTMTVLPGLADLRNNVRDTAITIVFSTGPTIATNRIGGVVFDWVAGRPAARALVEAIAPDSTTYVAVADSVGRFVVTNLPVGSYVVRGVLDANNNRAFDPREAFDTVTATPARVALGDSAKIELLAFVHDTVGARMSQVTVRDSMTLRITFDRALDPAQPLILNRIRVVSRDSVVVPVADVMTAVAYDSLQARRQRAADSTGRDSTARDSARAPRPAVPLPPRDSARRDTTRGRRPIPPPVQSRPSPPTEIVIVLGQPLRPNTFYRVSVRDQRSVSGTRVPLTERVITTPRAEPQRAPADSTRRAPADTTRRVPADTTRRVPADTTRRVPPADTARRRPR